MLTRPQPHILTAALPLPNQKLRGYQMISSLHWKCSTNTRQASTELPLVSCHTKLGNGAFIVSSTFLLIVTLPHRSNSLQYFKHKVLSHGSGTVQQVPHLCMLQCNGAVQCMWKIPVSHSVKEAMVMPFGAVRRREKVYSVPCCAMPCLGLPTLRVTPWVSGSWFSASMRKRSAGWNKDSGNWHWLLAHTAKSVQCTQHK